MRAARLISLVLLLQDQESMTGAELPPHRSPHRQPHQQSYR